MDKKNYANKIELIIQFDNFITKNEFTYFVIYNPMIRSYEFSIT